MSLLRFCLASLALHKPLGSSRRLLVSSQRHNLHYSSRNFCCCLRPIKRNGFISDTKMFQASSSIPKDFPFSGLEDALVSYLFGKKKATDIAHMVWKHIVQKGDTVVDATCGNGYDTLEMLKLVADDSGKGCVYAMDIQKDALDSTSSLLEESINQNQKQLVKLFNICHSKMEEAIPDNAPVRLSSGR